MINNTAFHIAASILVPSDFSREVHARIFSSMSQLAEDGAAIDLITVKDKLASNGHLEFVGGAAYLASLLDGMPRIGSKSVENWAGIIRNRAILRQLSNAADTIALVVEETTDPDVAVSAALDAVMSVAKRSAGEDTFAQPSKAAKATWDELEKTIAARDGITGVRTGFRRADAYMGGLKPGQLILMAGRPGMGKTAAAISIADNMAAEGKRVAFFSMEMGLEELTTRRITKKAEMSVWKMKAEGDKAWAKLAAIYKPLATDPLYIDKTPALTVLQMRARLQHLMAEHGKIDLVIVDYLQLARGSRRSGRSRTEEVAEIARDLKNLAKELDVPILALAQLSRECEKRENKRPMLSDLRESGELEQAADIVIFLYRHWVYDQGADKHESEWICAKQRNGPTWSIVVTYIPEWTAFFEDDPTREES